MRRFAAIPAHPQKQYTRRWRLYHFCGFYYPIREVIPIAIYHWNIGIVSRGKGKSAVAAAAYRSGEKLTNEWDGMTHDYTRKGGVVHTEIMLPPHAPPSFSDRSTLWNSVELYEKAGNAQLAREIDAALPIELSREEQIRLVREYCSSQFVSRGMCVDFAIHDTNSGNPHCHIMLTMRPLDERGAWAAKSKKEYDLDENGERIRLPSGRYKTHKIDLTGWNDKDNTLLWRKAWADFTNDFLERNGSPERIDHRSNAERGIDELPTVHMGVAACQMEKKGIATEKGELNRNIQKANRLIREIRAQIGKLKEWIADLFKARETAPEQPPQSPNLANLLMKYLSVQREKSRKYSQSWQHQHAVDELKTIAAAVNYLSEHGISNLDELDDSLSSVSDACKEVKTSDPVQIGSYRGYAMSVEFSAWKQEYTLLLKGQMTHRATLGTDPRGNLTRIDNALAQMPQRLEAAKAQLDNLYQQQAAAKEEVGKPFLYEEELRSKNARLVELDTLLNIDGKGQAHTESVVAKSTRPSVLDNLKRPVQPRSTDKKPKQHEEVR